MHPKGPTHEVVDDDQQGVQSIIKRLSYVLTTPDAPSAIRDSSGPVDRNVECKPTPIPYNLHLMLLGTDDPAGFFDMESWNKYLSEWGKSVIISRLGGIPMGAVAVETRLVGKIVPDDPADINSRKAVMPQVGL